MNGLASAASRLLAALAVENEALETMNLQAATAALPEKEAALTAFQAAMKAHSGSAGPGVDADALRHAADQNRRLLERAIGVQTRVLGIIAQAARASNPAPRYGRSGAYAARSVSGWALSARA